MTYEDILKRMLERVPSQIDKREGSVIYDALAPCAFELQLMYIELELILKETFGDTASREYLVRRALERGITPHKATYAVLLGNFNTDVPLGFRFRCRDLTYVVGDKVDDYNYKLRCEALGVIGNKNFGELIPIDYMDGLESARLTDLLIPAQDDEDTEGFRKRYFDSFDSRVYGGNVADYLAKTGAIEGVGATKVTPVWQGGGTVLLTILDSEYNKATISLLETVQNIIDPTGDGYGIGIAPIGHIVTVDTPREVEVNISTRIIFEEGYLFIGQKSKIVKVIDDYLLEIRKDWANRTNSIVRIAQIESRIMTLDGVLDINHTAINSSFSNLVLESHEIPILGAFDNG